MGSFPVLNASIIAPGIARLVVAAPRVAAHTRAGQFAIVRTTPDSERIPLTISAHDIALGTVTFVVQAVGRSTNELVATSSGDMLEDVLGPLGTATDAGPFGTVIVVAGGVGAAIALPVAAEYQRAGNHVIGAIGARDTTTLILIDELAAACNELHITTDDGSSGRAGLVTTVVAELTGSQPVDRVFAVGPIPMMQATADVTRNAGIPTVASLNPIMVDGTGMCGGCRVSVDGETRFACLDGPEFDAHAVDFESLARRNTAYRAFEACQLTIAEPHG